jgi:hypothetical protein
MIVDCSIDPTRLSVIAECIETYGTASDSPEKANLAWTWNVISKNAVVYSCGAIGRNGEILEHNHDPIELDLCRQLSQAAADIMAGQFIGMGDENDHELLPFYITANAGMVTPVSLTEAVIRAAFGGTIYPKANIAIEPLEVGEEWWEYMTECCQYQDSNATVESWLSLVAWFKEQTALHDPVFVSVSIDEELFADNGGCVFPRLAVALTAAGSLVGVFSCVVYT